ncbi:hypothetical protein I552_7629 [Mycobacterium xenopi 3993]|nr:hypothetical protein I552_7629 [Mycobacterium xenopi 3993]
MQFKVPDFSCRKSIRFYHIEWNRQGDGVAVRYGDIQHMLVGGESFGRGGGIPCVSDVEVAGARSSATWI